MTADRKEKDLSKQVKNFLIMMPIARLESGKKQLGPEGRHLFEDIDTLYLSFSLMDCVSESMFIENGASEEHIIEALCKEIKQLSSDISIEDRRLMATIVLERLTNAGESHRQFLSQYFDPIEKTTKILSFRLIDFSGGYYTLSKEGFAAYLSMLELDSEIAQEVDEFLIKLLLERGKFDDALTKSQDARVRTIQLRNEILRLRSTAERNVKNVDWEGVVKPELDRSRRHVEKRVEEEGNILKKLPDYVENASRVQKPRLSQIQDLIEECYRTHGDLQQQLMSYNSFYLDTQTHAFRLPGISNLLNLEDELLSDLLRLPISKISDNAEELTFLLNAMSVERIFDPVLIFELLIKDAEVLHSAASNEEEDSILEDLTALKLHFDDDLIHQMLEHLDEIIPRGVQTTFEEVIRKSIKEKDFTEDAIQCLIYLIMENYGEGLNEQQLVFGKTRGPKMEPISLNKGRMLSGDNLLITRKQK